VAGLIPLAPPSGARGRREGGEESEERGREQVRGGRKEGDRGGSGGGRREWGGIRQIVQHTYIHMYTHEHEI
jgi:hypothetical protein